jgi:hypothetical protein
MNRVTAGVLAVGCGLKPLTYTVHAVINLEQQPNIIKRAVNSIIM